LVLYADAALFVLDDRRAQFEFPVKPRGVVSAVNGLLKRKRWCELVLYTDAAAYGGDEL